MTANLTLQTIASGATLPSPLSRYREAFEATAGDRAALADEDLVTINIDIGASVQIALASVPRVAPLRAEIVALPVKHELIDKLELYARAAGHSHGVYQVASAPPEELNALYEDAVKRRATLRSDVQNLVNHGLVPADSLGGIQGETGYRNVGYDLIGLVAILRNAEEKVRNRTATLPEERDQAEFVAGQLLDVVARRDGNITVPAGIALDRQRAFTLLLRAYDETRRAVTFLRWGGEADKLAPSLYTSRVSRRRSAEEPEPSTSEVQPPPAPTTSATNGGNAPTVPGGMGGNPFA
jgi:hypothetical protein